MSETSNQLLLKIHYPVHRGRVWVNCAECGERWPCLYVSNYAMQRALAESSGHKGPSPWWFIPSGYEAPEST
jgi:hypothetical protein